MATTEVVVSDPSGAPDAETVTLGFNDQWHAVDLTESERAELNDVLRPYLAVSREARPPVNPKRIIPKTTAEERQAVRDWAHRKGFEFADRGVIPRHIRIAYSKAHPSEATDA